MCGIVGLIDLEGIKPSVKIAQRMLDAVAHRGPDNRSLKVINDSIIFGHARLAIFDVSSRANQPMEIEGSILSYNGEAYNFRDLASEYLSGQNLSTSSDTEVVLRLLQCDGISVVNKFSGFFAFSFFDGKTVYLVRDRFGQKPLYYSEYQGVLYFASEIKSLWAAGVPMSVDSNVQEQVGKYRFSNSLSPYEQVSLLPAGHYLSIEMHSRKRELHCYYSVEAEIEKGTKKIVGYSYRTIRQRTEDLFLNAVSKRLAADVPVGILCSGGLDSSLVAWAASQIQPITLYHVDVEGESEREFAEVLARSLDCELRCLKCTKQIFEDLMPDALLAYEYAMIHPNNVALLAIAHFAREDGVKVLLGGEGADELFGGYVHQYRYYLSDRLRTVFGQSMQNLFSQSRLPAARWKQYTKGGSIDFDRSIENLVDHLENLYQGMDLSRYGAFLLSDFLQYLPPLLLRGDKMTMAAGVELRLPFLDHTFVEWSMTMPARFRIKKRVLRDIAKSKLPSDIVKRDKMGFALPSDFYVSGDMAKQERSFIQGSIPRLSKLLEEHYGQ